MQYCSDTLLFSVLQTAFTTEFYQDVRLIMQPHITVVLSDNCKNDADSWKQMNNPRFIYSQMNSKQRNQYAINQTLQKEQQKHSMYIIL